MITTTADSHIRPIKCHYRESQLEFLAYGGLKFFECQPIAKCNCGLNFAWYNHNQRLSTIMHCFAGETQIPGEICVSGFPRLVRVHFLAANTQHQIFSGFEEGAWVWVRAQIMVIMAPRRRGRTNARNRFGLLRRDAQACVIRFVNQRDGKSM